MGAAKHIEQARANKPPRPIRYSRNTHTERGDEPCASCGDVMQRVTETVMLTNARPASMGPEEPHVEVRCNSCRHLIEEFDA